MNYLRNHNNFIIDLPGCCAKIVRFTLFAWWHASFSQHKQEMKSFGCISVTNTINKQDQKDL